MSQPPEPHPDPPRQEDISLGELTEAYAQAIGAGREGASRRRPEEAVRPETTDVAADQPTEPRPEPADHPCPISPRSILEAMLFVGNRDSRALSANRAAELMRGVEPEEIPGLIAGLNRRYAAGGCPYRVVHDGSGYRLALREAFYPVRNRFYGRIREARLSQAAVDVLAIVAYQQPLTAEQISRLRGRPSSHVLAQLVRRGLLRIQRQQTKRPAAQYFTTDRFLELFGLERLEDLPQSEDLDRQ